MSAAARIPLRIVFAMLDECAPGHRKTEKEHHWWVTFNGQTFQRLPIGERGSNRPDVFIGKVRSMVRLFGIQTCARRFISGV